MCTTKDQGTLTAFSVSAHANARCAKYFNIWTKARVRCLSHACGHCGEVRACVAEAVVDWRNPPPNPLCAAKMEGTMKIFAQLLALEVLSPLMSLYLIVKQRYAVVHNIYAAHTVPFTKRHVAFIIGNFPQVHRCLLHRPPPCDQASLCRRLKHCSRTPPRPLLVPSCQSLSLFISLYLALERPREDSFGANFHTY